MKLYRTVRGILAESEGQRYLLASQDWDDLMRSKDLYQRVKSEMTEQSSVNPVDASELLAPVVSQEVWAAGVTYFRSRNARMEESKDAGGGTFYDRVYEADRPELFFKSSGRKVVGPGSAVRIRADATWSVPEPELTLLINPAGKIVGYTIGNDMSSRDIEGENPLYLPQAKVYDGSCAIGPCVLLSPEPLSRSTTIDIAISRKGQTVFGGNTSLAELKREPTELAEYLFRSCSFPDGVFLMTGTGIVPGDEFTLASGDIIRISIQDIGTLENYVA